MKAQTKALVASVVVIALALSAVSGVTYSWFSDTEQADIDVTTAVVKYDVTWAENGSNDIGTAWTVNSTDKTVSISGLAAGASIPVVTAIDNGSTIKTVYRIAATIESVGNYTLYDLKNIYIGSQQLNVTGSYAENTASITYGETVITDWTSLDIETDPTLQAIYITTPQSYGGDELNGTKVIAYDPETGEGLTSIEGVEKYVSWSNETAKSGLKIKLSIAAVQGDYPTATLSEAGTATVPANGVVKGTAKTETGGKTMTVTTDFSSVATYQADGTGDLETVTGTTIVVSSEATGTTSGATIGSVAAVKLTLKSGDTEISSPTFSSPVVITTVISDVAEDPGAIEVQYNGSTEGITTISYVYDATAKTLTVTFSTTHFSQFNIVPVGIDAAAMIGGTYYDTLDGAFSAYSDSDYEAGTALVIMKDWDVPCDYEFSEDVIIDLNGHTFHLIYDPDGGYNTKVTCNFTLMNGYVVRNADAGYGHFTIRDNEKEINVKFQNITYTSNYYANPQYGNSTNALEDAIKVYANTTNNINLTVEGCSFTEGKIYLEGRDNAKKITTVISGCEFISEETNTCFIYLNSYGKTSLTTTVSDCTFDAGVTSYSEIIETITSTSDSYGTFSLTFKDSTVTAAKSTAENARFADTLSMTVIGGTNITVNSEKVTDNTGKTITF